MKDVTICVTTFQRQDCIDNCIDSIKKYYPDIKIYIADDSSWSTQLPFDVGLSYKRNWLLNQVKTKYVVFIDDDFQFYDETKLEKLREIIINEDVDLVAGQVRLIPKDKIDNYHGLLEIKDKTLTYKKGDKGVTQNGYPLYDIVLNFFMAKTESIRNIGWDNDLKLVEHTDFFLRAKDKLRVTQTGEITINHWKNNNERHDYDKYRNRYNRYEKRFKYKHDIDNIIPFGE
jgi:glycosyltransferase involved in cell wall biosynthesis